MGPSPAAALGTRSAHPDAPGFSRGTDGEAPAGTLPQPRTAAAPPQGDAAQPSLAGSGLRGFSGWPGALRPGRVPFNCSLSSTQAAGSFSVWRVFPGRLWLLQLQHAPAQPGTPDSFVFSANTLRFAFE